MGGMRYAMLSQVPYPSDSSHPPTPTHTSSTALLDSDIVVRRKAAFLLNSLLTPSAATTTMTSPSGTGLHTGPPQAGGAPVHPNSHASMVADPTLADTATATLRALRAHGLLPVLVRELTEPTPCGPDGDEGDGCDADLQEKLIRCVCVRPNDFKNSYLCFYLFMIFGSAGCCTRMCRGIVGRSMGRRRTRSGRSWMLGGLRQAWASWDLVRTSCGSLRTLSRRYLVVSGM